MKSLFQSGNAVQQKHKDERARHDASIPVMQRFLLFFVRLDSLGVVDVRRIEVLEEESDGTEPCQTESENRTERFSEGREREREKMEERGEASF